MNKEYLDTLAIFDESNSEDEALEKTCWCPFVVEMAKIKGYNESKSGYVTIMLNDGDRWTLGIKFGEFRKLFDKDKTMIKSVDPKAHYEYGEQ